MDINQWLQKTAEAEAAVEQSRLPDHLGFPAFLNPRDRAIDEASAKRHGRRRIQSGDDSILEVGEPATEPSASRRSDQVHQDADRGSSPDAPRESSASEIGSKRGDSELYRRKPRRKTQLDRYEKKSAKDTCKGQDKRERKRTAKHPIRGKPAKKRRKDRTALAAVVDNFHAESIPCQRLTVHVHALVTPSEG
jgi:hypothetical protein